MEKDIVNKLISNNETISSMESCTGGFFASTITNVEGSSKVFEFSAITYSKEYKIKFGVKKETIDKYSVYSFETTHEMSKCISNITSSTYGIGISGSLKNNSEKEVYATIYNKKDNTYTDIFIECPNKNRKKCKEYIVNKILKKINEIL